MSIEHLASGLLGALVGAFAGIYGARIAVMYTEYLRRSEKLKLILRNLLNQIIRGDISHAANAVKNSVIDNAVADIFPYMFPYKRCTFTRAWKQYRYNKTEDDIPEEYGDSSPKEACILVSKRLSHLISLLK